jgi:hypothetical protein
MRKLTLSLDASLLALALATSPLAAQDDAPPFESGEASLLIGTPHPTLFSDFKVEGYDYLEASLTVEDEGASVTWAPFLPPGSSGGYSFWSETRLQLSQKDDITSLGISFQYNPLNPRSDNGKAMWRAYWQEVKEKDAYSTFPLDLNDAKRIRKSRLEDREFSELTLLVNSNCPDLIPDSESDVREAPSKIEKLRTEVLEKWGSPISTSLLYRVHCALDELRGPLMDLKSEVAGAGSGEDPIKSKKKQLSTWSQAYSTLLLASESAYIEAREFNKLTHLADTNCASQDAEDLRQEVGALGQPAGVLLYRIQCALVEIREPLAELREEVAALRGEVAGLRKTKADEALLQSKQQMLDMKQRLLDLRLGTYSVLLSASGRAYNAQPPDEPGITGLTAIRAEIAELDKSIEKTTASYAESNHTGYRTKLYSSKKPIVNLSYVNSFFKVISGGEVGNDDDELNDNEHHLKSRSLALSVDWSLGERDGLSIQLSRSSERSSAEEGSPSADYDGFAATWSHRLVILNKDGYQKTKEFRESLFVPSIVFGLAYEAKDCDSPNPDCADGILRTQAVTPFVDFKIKKSAQFRIGIPFKRDRIFRMAEGETEEDSIDIVSLVAFQLGAPN